MAQRAKAAKNGTARQPSAASEPGTAGSQARPQRGLQLRRAGQPVQTDLFLEALWPTVSASPEQWRIRVARQDVLPAFPISTGFYAPKRPGLPDTPDMTLSEARLRPQ
ncbi:MAG TPA: hypothetical protein VFB38_08425 [Chthonomonadaceae bacterium]|nr:hypothetical protein [Chthonomonadaceae bacterium]